MIKKIIFLSVFCFLFIPMTFGIENKIATIKLQRIIDESKKGQELKDDLRKKFQSQEDGLKKKENILKNLQTELQSVLIKESAKESKRIEFQKLQLEYSQTSQSFLKEVRQAEQEQTRIILKELKEVVADYGKKKTYDFIFEEAFHQFVLFSKQPLVDITEEVIKLYDKPKK